MLVGSYVRSYVWGDWDMCIYVNLNRVVIKAQWMSCPCGDQCLRMTTHIRLLCQGVFVLCSGPVQTRRYQSISSRHWRDVCVCCCVFYVQRWRRSSHICVMFDWLCDLTVQSSIQPIRKPVQTEYSYLKCALDLWSCHEQDILPSLFLSTWIYIFFCANYTIKATIKL